MAKISPFEVVYPQYLVYVLLSNSTKLQSLIGNSSGVQPVILIKNIRQYFISLSTLSEQIQISEFLDKEVSNFDSLISKSKQQINFLQEKRQALITSAVTGKIDVRNGVA